MAFRLPNIKLENYEFRKMNEGTSSKGNKWVSLVLEDPDEGAQVEVSVPAEMQASIGMIGLRKGCTIDAPVVAVSGREYSFIRLTGLPVVLDAEVAF